MEISSVVTASCLFGKKEENIEKIKKIIQLIYKDLASAQIDAKNFFGIDVSLKNNKELCQELRQALERKKWYLVEGMHFSEVFCDIQGTLFSRNGNLNDKLLESLNKLAGSFPVNLWTGGDVEEVKRKFNFKREGICFPVLNKGFFRGSSVEIAYDDSLESTLLEKFKVTIKNFTKVFPWEPRGSHV